jgi:hypothetical protein
MVTKLFMLVVNAEGKSSTLKKRVNAATVPQGDGIGLRLGA